MNAQRLLAMRTVSSNLRCEGETSRADCVDEMVDEIERLQREADCMQAQIDSLMLEFCPENMTQEQRLSWGNAQQQKPKV